jgi:hypothetical protein
LEENAMIKQPAEIRSVANSIHWHKNIGHNAATSINSAASPRFEFFFQIQFNTIFRENSPRR